VYASGRADYIRLVDASDAHTYNVEFYMNTGTGGTMLKGDGVYYCDMYGRGHDDYLWVSSDGRISLYENDDSPPTWTSHDSTDVLDTGRDRKSLHFGGKCVTLDYLFQDHVLTMTQTGTGTAFAMCSR
jgi:hypothetical protein